MRSLESCCSSVHYAYVVLIVATLGKIFSSPGQSPCIGVIIEDVRLDVNISRSMMTGLYFAATTTSAFILPLGGKWIDRFGPRVMVFVFACGLGLACMVMSRVAAGEDNNEAATAIDDARNKMLNCLHLLLAFFLLRFFGQGNMMNVSIIEINYWWIEKRGLVMGIAGSIVSATMLGIVPIIMMSLMTSVGWRQTYVILGMASLFVMAPSGLLFFRGKPEQYGLLPDAKQSTADDDSANKNMAEVTCKENVEDWTAEEVFRSRAFYVFACSDLIIAGTGTAFYFHLRSVFEESGFSKATVSTLYPMLAVVSVVGRLFSGWLIDATSQRHVLSIGLVLHSMGLAMVPVMMTPNIIDPHNIFNSKNILPYAVALLIGSSGSFCSNVRATVYAEYYGRKQLGAVQSLASSLTVFGSAIGPFPFGIARDLTGSFALPFGVAAVFPLMAAVAVFVFGKRGPHIPRPIVGTYWTGNDESVTPLKKGYGSV